MISKILKLSDFKDKKALEAEIKKNGGDMITGTIFELNKFNLRQDSQVLGIQIKPDPEEIEAKGFKSREELEAYIKDLLGDNLTINRVNQHRIIGTKKDLDILFLSKTSQIYGCWVEESEEK